MLTDAEKKELEILEAIEAGNLTQDEGDELLKLEGFAASESEPEPEEEPGVGSQALDMGMRALDWAGGMGRMAASGYVDLYNLATDQPLLNEPDTFQKALKGQAPTTEDYLQKSGMEDSVGRAALGFVGDVALDPTTYMSGGATAGVSKIDETLELAGKGKLSDIMIEEGIVGTNKQIKKKLGKLSNRFAKDRKAMYESVEAAGGKVDTTKIMDEFAQYTDKFRAKTGNEIGDQIAGQMEEQLLKALPDASEITLKQASNIKSQVRKSLPETFYGPFGNVKDEYKAGVDKISSLFQKNIEEAAETALPGMGQTIAKKNKDWSVLLDADSPLGREARNASGKNYITSVDAMVGAGTFVGAGKQGAGTMLAAKKLADAMKTTAVRTVGGREVKNIGLINYNRQGE